MEEVKLLSQQRNVPRENCGICQHTGLVCCPDCGGTGRQECSQCHGDGKAWGGVGGECPCQYNDAARDLTWCSSCNGSGKKKCTCVVAHRLVWEDYKDILGHKAIVHVMAEQDANGSWVFYTRESTETTWQAMPVTDLACKRVAQVEAMITAGNQKLRKKLRALVASLPDDTDELSKAQKRLEELQKC